MANWLGLADDFSFDTVEDKQSSSGGSELLQCGLYKAKITEVTAIEEGTPKLVVTFELEEGKTIKTNYWLTKFDNPDSANVKNLKNLLTRALYSDLTEKEFRAIDTKEVAERCNKVIKAIANKKTFASAFVDKKVLVDVTQESFFSKDKDTKEIKFMSNVKKQDLPQQLQKVIDDYQDYNNCTLDKVPQFAFSNKVKMYGVHFYNDFRKDAKYFDTKAYEFVQGLKNNNVGTANNVVDDIEEIAF